MGLLEGLHELINVDYLGEFFSRSEHLVNVNLFLLNRGKVLLSITVVLLFSSSVMSDFLGPHGL